MAARKPAFPHPADSSDAAVAARLAAQQENERRFIAGTEVAILDGAATRVDEGDPDDAGNLDDAEDEFSQLGRVLGELDASATGANIKIWRLDARDPKLKVFVDEIAPQDFSLKHLSDNYGGGRYRIMVYVPRRDPDGTLSNLMKLAANKILAIDGPPKVRREETPGVPAVAQDSTAATVALARELANAMQAGFSQLANMIQQGNRQPGMNELLQNLVVFKQLFASDARPGSDPMTMMKSTLDMVKQIEEMRALSSGGENDGVGSVGGVVIGKLMERFLSMHDKLPPDNAGAPLPIVPALDVAAPSAPPVAPVAPPVHELTAEDETMGMQELMIRAACSDVLKHAARNTPVDEYAPVVYDEAPDALLEFLEREDWYQLLCAAAERAKLYPVWLKALRDAVLKLAREDDGGADLGDDAPGT